MSNAIFPDLPGITWPVGRTILPPPVATKTTPSRREFRMRSSWVPLYRFTLAFEFLRTSQAQAEWQQLQGFYNARGGSFDDFVFIDKMDNAVSGQLIGTGDGVSTQFQLVRSLGSFVEPVYGPTGTPTIQVSGGTVSATVSATGLVTLAAAAGVGAPVTWTGTYGWRCRFDGASVDLEQFAAQYFSAKKVVLQTVKPL